MNAPERIYVPTGVLNTATARRDRGETRGIVLTSGDKPWYEDDVVYIRADAIPWERIEDYFRKVEKAGLMGTYDDEDMLYAAPALLRDILKLRQPRYSE